MLMNGARWLRTNEAAPLLGMTTRQLRDHLKRGDHGMDVHERRHVGRVHRYLRADQVVKAGGGAHARVE